ncbi:choline dehydrogenase [Apiospora kogelbergensis]|uniref:choline dehydrogenase n=1 Tax=Apiospora kogelbergensis TaxID=1337665 RepID=UPI0031328845
MKSLVPLLAYLAITAGGGAHASPLSEDTLNKSDYEYIVVGSGPGGGPLAANLARRGRKVLLLEAGDDQGLNINQTVPAFGPTSSEDETMSWGFFVKHFQDPQEAAKDPKMAWDTPDGKVYVGLDPPHGSTQKGIFYPRAGTLGGCGSHNALIATLPRNSDWEYIADATGDRSWSPDAMQKYFERLERCLYLPKGTPGHGFDGWLEMELQDKVWQDSNKEILKPALKFSHQKDFKSDMNAPHAQDADGTFSLPLTMSKRGRRNGARSFVVATANARNKDGSKKYPLYVKTHAFVTKVLFDDDFHGVVAGGDDARKPARKPKAVGVEYVEGKSLYKADPRSNPKGAPPAENARKRIRASREVVVAGGAFNTPQILKLSGIGPKAELRKFNIPVRVDLPGVGTNLQDNYEYSVAARSPQVVSLLAKGVVNGTDTYLQQWKASGTGPYKGDGIETAVLNRTRLAKTDEEDLFLYSTPLYFTGFFPGYSKNATGGDGHAYTWIVLKFRQEDQSGTVTLRSGNPFDVPTINFEFYADPDAAHPHNDGRHDLDVMAEGVRIVRGFLDAVPSPGVGPLHEVLPGRDATNTAEKLRHDIKHNSFSHHAASSCPIGGDGDPWRGLRVVDASVFPRVPGTFPQLPVYMISEKAVDVMLEDAGFRPPHKINYDDATLESIREDEVLIEN